MGSAASLFVVELVKKSDLLHNVTRNVTNQLQ